MPNIEDLKATIGQVEDLQSVVKTMKALAAVSIRQYQQAVESLDEYVHTIEMGLQIIVKQRYFAGKSVLQSTELADEVAPYRLLAIAFGSDQGLCGQFNERLAQYVMDWKEQHQQAIAHLNLVTVGSRLAPLLPSSIDIEAQFSMPHSAEGIITPVNDLLSAIEKNRSELHINRILLFYNRPTSGATYEPHGLQLWPFSRQYLLDLERRRWPTRQIPMGLMPWRSLLSSLIRQFLFVALYRAFAASLAAENASRLAAMQSAESNIDERLDELNSHYRRQRQSTITSEMLDVVSGSEALKDLTD